MFLYTNGIVSSSSITETSSILSNNKSILFDGIDQRLSISSITSLDNQDNFSISFWFKPNGSGGTVQYFLSKNHTTSYNARRLALRWDTTTDKIEWDINSLVARVVSTVSLNSGSWYNLCMTWDGTEALNEDRPKIYINGTLQTSTASSNVTSIDSDTSPLVFGCWERGTSSPVHQQEFSGHMDEIMIFNSTLNQSDVTDYIYNSGIPLDLSSRSDLIHWYRMGDGDSYPTIYDNAGSNDGTMINMVSGDIENDVPKFNQRSILFDGVNDRIDLASRTQNFTDFSLSFWVVWGGGNYKTIVGSSVAQGGILYSIVQAGGQIRYYDNTSGWTIISDTISDGNWHHILITYDSNANTLKGYTDGSLSITKTSVDPYNTTNAHSFNQIGARLNGSIYNEKLDEIAVWDSVLDATQATNIYSSGTPNDLSGLSPVHWWRMGDGDSSTTVYDNGSGGNDGTLVSISGYSTDTP